MPENNQDERHYKSSTLNILFAVASIVLLLSLVGMFANDYIREWKGFQRDFRELEIQNTRVKSDLEQRKLDKNEEYTTVKTQLEENKKKAAQQSVQIKKLEQEAAKIQSDYNIANQQNQFVRAKLDAQRYVYEEALSHKRLTVEREKKKLNDFEKKIAELRLKVESLQNQLQEKQSQIAVAEQDLTNKEKEYKTLTKQLEIFDRKLKKIDPQEMSLATQFGNIIRDLPVIDLANPKYKIQQVVISDIRDNVNFLQVPKVDRCITCHLGIANPDYKDAPQPFRTHPKLDLFVGNNSSHPLEEFGCTSCHGGRGRGTDFVSSVHTPSSEKQKEEWEKKYNWHEMHHWEAPMYALPNVEASCFKCHSGQTAIKGAEKLNFGLNLIERAGCYGCHTIEKFKDWPKPGPDLARIASKSTPDWTYQWITNPKSFRHNTWMPAFFEQSNNSDPESLKRTQQEIHAIVQYLFNKSATFEMQPLPPNGNPKKGEEIVSSVGCFGCHNIQPEKGDGHSSTLQLLRREHGPNLIGLGTKTTKQWLYNWLKDPNRYHPGTRMPNLRLSDEEAADVAAYLSIDQKEDFVRAGVPTVDEATLNTIVLDFLLKSNSVDGAKAKLAKMNLDEKLMLSGEKLISHYGCFGCHNIPGFENSKPIGTDLSEEGSKDAHGLDFGFVHIEHTKTAWFKQKLADPRIFDQGKVKEHYDKLRMPNYHFNEREIEAITTAILGFVKDRPAASKMKARSSENLFVEKGQEIVRQFNCQGCHIMEDEGGSIRPTITQWLEKYQNRSESEAQAVTVSFSPPNLIGEGKKVQTEWLFNFIHHPETIRPWLSVRMPTYYFDASQINSIMKYFNYLDHEEFPFSDIADYSMTPEEHEAGAKLFSKEYFGCAQCHIVGSQMPGGSPDSWAPDFALANKRLKPKWIAEWLHDPQVLQPGTKMPTYFDPSNFESAGPEDLLGGDEEKQIEALRDYILTLSSSSGTTPPGALTGEKSEEVPPKTIPEQSKTSEKPPSEPANPSK